jgi:hypothetical protein
VQINKARYQFIKQARERVDGLLRVRVRRATTRIANPGRMVTRPGWRHGTTAVAGSRRYRG